MQEYATITSLGLCFILGQIDGMPTWLADFSSVGILGFVVYFTLTRIEPALMKLDQTISRLNENISTLKGDHAAIERELEKIEKDLEK